MPASYCPECGGEMFYDPPSKNYICRSCGVLYSREQLAEIKEKQFRTADDERSLAKKRRREVLKWWLSDKAREE
ncbi:MAG: TFIIB-type zinc ribbon-containing protein [Candidatus Bathyarchaeia archaeon]